VYNCHNLITILILNFCDVILETKLYKEGLNDVLPVKRKYRGRVGMSGCPNFLKVVVMRVVVVHKGLYYQPESFL